MYVLNDRTKYENAIYTNEVERTLLMYINNVLINGSYIKSLSYNAEIFDNNKISLGSALVDEIKVSINKEGVPNLNDINEFYFEEKITYEDGTSDTIPIGYFYSLPNNIDASSNDFINFNLKSKMEFLKEPFKASELINSGIIITRRKLVEAICEKYNLYLASDKFINEDVVVGNYDNSIYATSYLTMISERAGGFAYIGRTKKDGKLPLYIKSLNETDKVDVPTNTLGEYEKKDKVTISKISYTNGVVLYEKGDDTGITIHLSNNNVFTCTEQEVINIYNSLKDLTFQSLVVKIWGDSTISKGDLIKIGDLVTFAQISWDYQRGFIGSYRTKLEEVKSSIAISKISASEERRVIRTEMNELEGKMEITAELVDGQNEKISKVTQTVEELNSKISDVADITISAEDNDGQVELANINQSEPIRIVVKPIEENISYLYPSDNLYPSDTLYLKDRIIRFNNLTTQEIFEYELPEDLLYYDSENYDEFILDYDSQSCVVNKKVGYNDNGTTYILNNPRTLEFEYPKILLTDGDYEINLPSYENAYLFVRLMAQNIYTTQFATRAEVKSEINQTANSISLEVSQKVGQNEVVSSINNAIKDGQGVIEFISNSIVIDSKNFTLNAGGTIRAKNGTFEGTIESTNGTIGGWKLDKSGLSNGIYYINKDGYSNIYVTSDILICQLIILGTIPTPTANTPLFRHYDINNDGVIDLKDMLLIQKMILGGN